MGTQRKKAEHAMFESHFEGRASSMKRLRNRRAKTCAEDHATPLGDSAFEPWSHGARAKIDERSFENRRNSIPNRPQIDEKSMLEWFDFLFDFWMVLESDLDSFFIDFEAYVEEAKVPKVLVLQCFWYIFKNLVEVILGCILNSSWLDFEGQLDLQKRRKIQKNRIG